MPSVLETLAAHSDNPSSFLALNSGNTYFHDDRFEGTCAYRTSGRYALQFGGPFAAPEHRARLLDAFAAHTGRRLVAVQLQRADAELYAAHGFTVNQLGASYAVDLTRFTLRGSRFVRLRNKISRARRAGLEVAELADGDDRAELDRIDQCWLREKGRHVKELRFLVGQRTGELQRHRRLFVGRIDGRFQFTGPRGFDGFHEFSVEVLDDSHTVLRNTLVVRPHGIRWLAWALIVRPLHDAVFGLGLDRAERALTGRVARPVRCGWYVRLLREAVFGRSV
ncbi:phosphatidylglycerol lysyltransferase domain-containing protein [Streptomyces parvulus]|uniref:phosphatidylglycerol lysyltransferase domain-containing protein n=1 Tax=Streptomyces parvulus TaxID=146923 RepID=UPI003809115A